MTAGSGVHPPLPFLYNGIESVQFFEAIALMQVSRIVSQVLLVSFEVCNVRCEIGLGVEDGLGIYVFVYRLVLVLRLLIKGISRVQIVIIIVGIETIRF